MSRTELNEQVNYWFYENHPDAPRPLGRNGPADLREKWVHMRDEFLNHEVDRVYWARHPEAPTQLDETSPEWEGWRQAWLAIREEVMANAPDLEDVQIQNAVSETGELDLSHAKAAVRQFFLLHYEQEHAGYFLPLLMDTVEVWIATADELVEEVGQAYMASGDVHATYDSREVVVVHGGLHATISVHGFWGTEPHFTASPELLVHAE